MGMEKREKKGFSSFRNSSTAEQCETLWKSSTSWRKVRLKIPAQKIWFDRRLILKSVVKQWWDYFSPILNFPQLLSQQKLFLFTRWKSLSWHRSTFPQNTKPPVNGKSISEKNNNHKSGLSNILPSSSRWFDQQLNIPNNRHNHQSHHLFPKPIETQ